jgi:hypothetical protein
MERFSSPSPMNRHGTCFHRRLSAHRAGAAPHSAFAELGVVRPLRTLYELRPHILETEEDLHVQTIGNL